MLIQSSYKIPKSSSLPSFLSSNDLESGGRFLLRSIGRAFLGNFTPAATRPALGVGGWREAVAAASRRFDNTFIGKLAPTDEFFCEPTTIKSRRVGVDGVGDDLGLGWKHQKLLHKVIHYMLR